MKQCKQCGTWRQRLFDDRCKDRLVCKQRADRRGPKEVAERLRPGKLQRT